MSYSPTPGFMLAWYINHSTSDFGTALLNFPPFRFKGFGSKSAGPEPASIINFPLRSDFALDKPNLPPLLGSCFGSYEGPRRVYADALIYQLHCLLDARQHQTWMVAFHIFMTDIRPYVDFGPMDLVHVVSLPLVEPGLDSNTSG